MTTCSLRKIMTEVVFELTAEGRIRCQMCALCGSMRVPQDSLQQVRLGPGGADEKLCQPRAMVATVGEQSTALHRWPGSPASRPSLPPLLVVWEAQRVTWKALSSVSG